LKNIKTKLLAALQKPPKNIFRKKSLMPRKLKSPPLLLRSPEQNFK
jgi:hypothetical protein